MLSHKDGSESEEKCAKFYACLESQPFVPQPDIDDRISENNFFVICRDIFGINTFTFVEDEVHYHGQSAGYDESTPQPEDYDQDNFQQDEGEYLVESPMMEQPLMMSAIPEATSEQNDDEEYEIEGETAQYTNDNPEEDFVY